jgi:hypothetical protein
MVLFIIRIQEQTWETLGGNRGGGHVEGVGNEPGAFLIITSGRNHDTAAQLPI